MVRSWIETIVPEALVRRLTRIAATLSIHRQSRSGLLVSVLLCLMATMSGCSGIGLLNGISPRGGYGALTGLAYGDHGQLLDVYKPDRVTRDAPVVVFIYGGSWQKDLTYSRSDYRFVGEALAARGFVVVVPDYRLYPDVRFPDFVDDCAQAVVWAHGHAQAYGGDPDRLVVMGHSAGAYNAAMLALDPAYLQRAGGDRAWLRAMVGLAGPYDFLPLTDPALQAIFAPAQPLVQSQPIAHVDGQAPPLLLLAGNDDDVVYTKNTRNLAAAVRARGGIAEEHIYPSMSHIKIVATTATRLQGFSDVMDRVADFINRYDGVRPSP